MKKRTKRWISALTLLAGTVSAAGLVMVRGRKKGNQLSTSAEHNGDVWARPGMNVTFRAELMPGVAAANRTFAVTKLLPSGRVILNNIAGEHAENEFEPLKR